MNTNVLNRALAVQARECTAGINHLVVDGNEFGNQKDIMFYTVPMDGETIQSGKLLKE